MCTLYTVRMFGHFLSCSLCVLQAEFPKPPALDISAKNTTIISGFTVFGAGQIAITVAAALLVLLLLLVLGCCSYRFTTPRRRSNNLMNSHYGHGARASGWYVHIILWLLVSFPQGIVVCKQSGCLQRFTWSRDVISSRHPYVVMELAPSGGMTNAQPRFKIIAFREKCCFFASRFTCSRLGLCSDCRKPCQITHNFAACVGAVVDVALPVC